MANFKDTVIGVNDILLNEKITRLKEIQEGLKTIANSDIAVLSFGINNIGKSEGPVAEAMREHNVKLASAVSLCADLSASVIDFIERARDAFFLADENSTGAQK